MEVLSVYVSRGPEGAEKRIKVQGHNKRGVFYVQGDGNMEASVPAGVRVGGSEAIIYTPIDPLPCTYT